MITRLRHPALTFAFLFVTSPDAIAAPTTYFDDGTTQGWTPSLPFGGSLVVDPGFGNPDGSLIARDSVPGGGALYARAPSSFTGDFSKFQGLRWDEFVFDQAHHTLSPTHAVIVGGNPPTTYWFSEPLTVKGAWHTRWADFSSPSWQLTTAVFATGNAPLSEVLQGVTALYLQLDCSNIATNNLEAAVDNVALAPFVGDANEDGHVTAADYTLWADNFGLGPGATFAQGDFNLDGFVNGADYTLWADHYTGLPPGGAMAVPEPSTAMLALTALLVTTLTRARSLRRLLPCGATILAAALGMEHCSASTASVTFLSWFPTRVSSNGNTAVGFEMFGTRTYVWSREHGESEFVGSGVGSQIYLDDVSDDGNVLLGREYGSGQPTSFLWSNAKGFEYPHPTAVFNSMSGDATYLVGYTPPNQPVLWHAGAEISLGPAGRAFDISRDGGTVLVGNSNNGSNYLWNESGTTAVEPPPDLINASTPRLSADGSVVVGTGSRTVNGRPGAFMWTLESGPRLLSVGEDPVETWAMGAAIEGRRIAGGYYIEGGERVRPVYWDADGKAHDLQVVLSDGYGIDLGDWTLEDVAAISDDGSTMVGYADSPTFGVGGYIVTLPPVAAAGDANGDGLVSPADYTLWADNFGLGPGATFAQGDFNLDGFVNGADYTLWADHYTGLPDASQSVPEPTSAVLAIVGALLLAAPRIRGVRRWSVS